MARNHQSRSARLQPTAVELTNLLQREQCRVLLRRRTLRSRRRSRSVCCRCWCGAGHRRGVSGRVEAGEEELERTGTGSTAPRTSPTRSHGCRTPNSAARDISKAPDRASRRLIGTPSPLPALPGCYSRRSAVLADSVRRTNRFPLDPDPAWTTKCLTRHYQWRPSRRVRARSSSPADTSSSTASTAASSSRRPPASTPSFAVPTARPRMRRKEALRPSDQATEFRSRSSVRSSKMDDGTLLSPVVGRANGAWNPSSEKGESMLRVRTCQLGPRKERSYPPRPQLFFEPIRAPLPSSNPATRQRRPLQYRRRAA